MDFELEEKQEQAFSGNSVLVLAPLKLTEEQQRTIEQGVVAMFEQNRARLERAALYHFDHKSINGIIKKVSSRFQLRDRPCEIDWALRDKGEKPLFQALKQGLRRANIVILFDDGDYMGWMKKYISEQAVDGKMKLFVKNLGVNKDGEES